MSKKLNKYDLEYILRLIEKDVDYHFHTLKCTRDICESLEDRKDKIKSMLKDLS